MSYEISRYVLTTTEDELDIKSPFCRYNYRYRSFDLAMEEARRIAEDNATAGQFGIYTVKTTGTAKTLYRYVRGVEKAEGKEYDLVSNRGSADDDLVTVKISSAMRDINSAAEGLPDLSTLTNLQQASLSLVRAQNTYDKFKEESAQAREVILSVVQGKKEAYQGRL